MAESGEGMTSSTTRSAFGTNGILPPAPLPEYSLPGPEMVRCRRLTVETECARSRMEEEWERVVSPVVDVASSSNGKGGIVGNAVGGRERRKRTINV
jgi:hypothetical protein